MSNKQKLQYIVATEPKSYRCTNGIHEWHDVAITPAFTWEVGQGGAIHDLCPHCLREALLLLLQQVGQIQEIQHGNQTEGVFEESQEGRAA